MTPITGTVLDKLARHIFSLEWIDARAVFVIREECDGYHQETLTPNELCDLAREMLRAAVTKGGY